MKIINSYNPLLNHIPEDVMGFLNEIQIKFPGAISLASGRPDEGFFNIDEFKEYFDVYVNTIASSQKKDKRMVINELGQYNKTSGIINDLISKFLEEDESIHVHPKDIIMTVGAQEALLIAITTLCDKSKDIILIEDPTYVGITHLSILSGCNVQPVPVDFNGISLIEIEEKILSYQKLGKKVKLIYVIPDYQNPTGCSMPLSHRKKLLDLATKYDFLILEDNAYGEFIYEGSPLPSIKSLDHDNRVIYIRSFSKTLYPSLRLAAMVANQAVNYSGKEVALSELMSFVKGYLTVNTPSINQAILGGILIKNKFSFKQINADKIANLKEKREMVLKCLDRYCKVGTPNGEQKIKWNLPLGGFFLTIFVPFKINGLDVLICADKFKVIFTPMSFFYFNGGGENEIRIAFSNIKIEKIATAIERLGEYFKFKINQQTN